MFKPAAIGFAVAFIGVIALVYLILQVILGNAIVDNSTITYGVIALIAIFGGGVVVALKEMGRT